MANLTAAPYVYVIDSDNVIELAQLTDSRTNTIVAGATVTCRVQTRDGIDVGGAAWPIDMTEVLTIPGTYRGILPDTLVVDEETAYIVTTSAVAPSGLHRTFRTRFLARETDV